MREVIGFVASAPVLHTSTHRGGRLGMMARARVAACGGVLLLGLACGSQEGNLPPLPDTTSAEDTVAAAVTKPQAIPTLVLDGRVLPISPTEVQGFLDYAEQRGDSVFVYGWAADTISLVVADSVLVLVNGEVVKVVRTGVDRPGLGTLFGSAVLRRAGFVAGLALSDLGSAGDLRVFAFAGRNVSELSRTGAFILPEPRGSSSTDSVAPSP